MLILFLKNDAKFSGKSSISEKIQIFIHFKFDAFVGHLFTAKNDQFMSVVLQIFGFLSKGMNKLTLQVFGKNLLLNIVELFCALKDEFADLFACIFKNIIISDLKEFRSIFYSKKFINAVFEKIETDEIGANLVSFLTILKYVILKSKKEEVFEMLLDFGLVSLLTRAVCHEDENVKQMAFECFEELFKKGDGMQADLCSNKIVEFFNAEGFYWGIFESDGKENSEDLKISMAYILDTYFSSFINY